MATVSTEAFATSVENTDQKAKTWIAPTGTQRHPIYLTLGVNNNINKKKKAKRALSILVVQRVNHAHDHDTCPSFANFFQS